MNKLYILDHSIDEKVIGTEYPQCIGLLKGYNNEYENRQSLNYFAHQKGKQIDFKPDFSAIKIGVKTKLTDCISCSLGPGNDLVVSSKFKKIISGFNTSPLQIFKCALHRKEEVFDYWWIHYLYTLEKAVDYQSSDFKHVDEELQEKLKNIRTYEDYRRFYDNDDTFGLVRASTTVLNTSPLDFFVVGQFNQKRYVSERFRDELEIKGVTGVTFKEATDVCFS